MPDRLQANGYINRALLRPVTASSVAPNQPSAFAVDGDDGTYWESKNTESEPWIVVHLERKYSIDRVVLPLFAGFQNLVIQVWNGAAWAEVYQGSADDQILFGFDPVKTDKIRLVPAANEPVRIYEIKVYTADPQPVFVNQSGFNLNRSKRFTAPLAEDGSTFHIKRKGSSKILYHGETFRQKGDFTDFTPEDPGPYVITVNGEKGTGTSVPFNIGPYWLERVSYRKAIEFMVDSRCWWGDARGYAPTDDDSRCTRGVAWRDGVQYSFEVPSLIMMYLANPSAFTTERMPVQGPYLGLRHELPEDTPEIVKLIYWGIDIFLRGRVDHALLKEQLAYFVYAYPYLSNYIPRSVYDEARDYLFKVWAKSEYERFEDNDWNMPDFYTIPHTSNLFQTYTILGTGKGQFPPGHSIVPNLMMYEVAKREGREDAQRYFKAAYDQAKWLIDNLNWNDPKVTKGQRQGEWVTITSFVYFLRHYSGQSPDGLTEKIRSWAKVMIARSDNMWDFRRYSGDRWVIPNILPADHPLHAGTTGFNEPGNVAGFPAPLLAAAQVLKDPVILQRLNELAVAHLDNVFGRNPTGRHFSYDGEKDFEGVELGWFKEYQGGAGQLQSARGVLDGSPKETTYPFNPRAGDPGHTEGWVTFNTAWNVALAYLSMDDTDLKILDNHFRRTANSVSTNETLGIQLEAPLNFDYETVESGEVHVKASNGDSLTLSVNEASPNNRYFRGMIDLGSGDVKLDDQVIQCKSGDRVTASYGYGFFRKSVSVQIVQ